MLIELVLAQLQAWNAADLTKMMSYYHDDVAVYSRASEEPVLSSKQMIIEHTRADFEAGAVDRIEVIAIIEAFPYVLTIEEKQPRDKPPFRGVFTYYFEDNKIKRLWFERVPDEVSKITEDYIRRARCEDALAGPMVSTKGD
jgi:hypothetical protein